jgi:hypothetical protein
MIMRSGTLKAPRQERTLIQEDLKATVGTPNVAIHGESAEEVKKGDQIIGHNKGA